ncbi:unnamed protein product, partial [Leptidea sinapis]
ERALENINKSKETSKRYYDSSSSSKSYKVGDMVYLKQHHRLRKALSPVLFFNSCSTEPIHPISNSPGIYFDPTSEAYFYDDFWNVVTHIDILRSIINLNDFCEKVQNLAVISIDCKDSINPLEILINSSFLKYDSLSHLISENPENRTKRALEFGGEVLKFFFGTLDADDARKYDEAISICQESEKEIYTLMKNNIHIMKSTIGNFNETIIKLNNNETQLNNRIEKLNFIFQDQSKINSKIINIEKINSILNIIEGSLLSVTNILDAILNSILFAKANILHPYVLSPSKLYDELSNSKCKNVNFEYMISPQPAILSTINNPSCESKLLSEVTLSLPDICVS